MKNHTIKTASFDFEMDSFVGVEAPVGTDPETLYEKALALFSDRLSRGELIINYFQTYDHENGDIT